jgi:hypothetical protein
MVRETINQYINHLKQLTHQDMNTKNKEEIINMIIANKQLIESAEYIFSIRNEYYRKIFTNVMDDVKKIAEKLGIESYLDVNDLIGKAETSFSFFKKEWNDYCILFHFSQEYNLQVGVIKRDHLWSNDDLLDQALKRYLSDFKIAKYEPHEDDWPWGIKLDNLSLSEFPEKLSFEVIKEIVVKISDKLDGFKEWNIS